MIENKLQKEVDRITTKYQDCNEEFDVLGDSSTTNDTDITRDDTNVSEEKIVNILKDL